ncbi:hypothetical protein, variant 1 [Phytophthora nicotianae INRA-310]|uniref:Uncharacterized protein n=1 Tax=Phytophthora nicotianae (strain INRA-310) TaxID=761204 RepID=W2QT58_PHYN3|nr:hypothetical protein PPTG_06734 [Phytophthora nicotianae INRA-310]XP_008899024.1 hypothetical protein, variant 1 [Phytophthora nicotianae INRA-310]ETN15465.1 hypothetical protein PPTG_06734 [Phytophthora nicotianae INRA-310]ETN15466.1 hypothetical protein, variant 1 [Phytophthora nicotianae INRA-310]
MELSEYEAKRQRRIKANQQQLQALNVPKIPQYTPPPSRKKKEVGLLYPVRRSLRQRQQREATTEPLETETEALIALGSPPRAKRAKMEPPVPLDLPVTQLSSPNKGKKLHISSSQIEIQLEEFHGRCLGTQLLPVGKQTAMQGLCPPGYVAKFSKMSGVQPWKNSVALFLNVESESPYDNVFHLEDADGRSAVHFQWFGQNRWHDESPLVMRLRKAKRGDERLRFDETYYDKDSEKEEEPLLLFLRHTQGPYIYCGRLGYLGHRRGSKPLEFRWQLLDVNSLQWEKVQGLLASSETTSKTDSK